MPEGFLLCEALKTDENFEFVGVFGVFLEDLGGCGLVESGSDISDGVSVFVSEFEACDCSILGFGARDGDDGKFVFLEEFGSASGFCMISGGVGAVPPCPNDTFAAFGFLFVEKGLFFLGCGGGGDGFDSNGFGEAGVDGGNNGFKGMDATIFGGVAQVLSLGEEGAKSTINRNGGDFSVSQFDIGGGGLGGGAVFGAGGAEVVAFAFKDKVSNFSGGGFDGLLELWGEHGHQRCGAGLVGGFLRGSKEEVFLAVAFGLGLV